MDARAPRPTNWKQADRAPPHAVDDVELVEWGNDASFRRQRAEWLRDIQRMGDVKFANMQVICSVVAGYMGAKEGSAWPSLERLAADLGWSKKTVQRALDDAVRWGWLSKSRKRLSNEYLMSFSGEVRAAVMQWHADRIAAFEAASRQKKELAAMVRFDHFERPDLTTANGQTCPPAMVKPDHQSCPVSSITDPEERSGAERLGEGEQDIGEGAEQKKALLDDVISALGRGDLEEGQRIADGLNPARLDWLVSLADREGMVGAHQAIVEARKSASPHL